MPVALITGILGQDGSLLAELLLARDYRVIGIVRPGAVPPLELRAMIDRCELVEHDLSRDVADELTAVVRRHTPDEIYHLAACHHSSEHPDDPAQQQRMVAVNHAAALALAHAVLVAKRGHLVVAASSQMYTPALPARTIDETTARAPATFYGVTKAATVDALAWLRAHQELTASCAILFNHESSRRPPTFVSRKIAIGAARIAAGLARELEVFDVSRRVDFSSAADVVEALHAMARGAPADRVVASGELHGVDDLCRVAFAAFGLDWRDHVKSRQPPGERPALVGDRSGIERDLGWAPRRAFDAWVTDMAEVERRSLM